MTKTEKQQSALDELVARHSRCSFANNRRGFDCNDPRSTSYAKIGSWCYHCLCDELEGAKIGDHTTPLKRWVCRDDDGWISEMFASTPPKKSAGGDWEPEKQQTDSEGLWTNDRFVTNDAEAYELVTGIHLEPGDGPIEIPNGMWANVKTGRLT